MLFSAISFIIGLIIIGLTAGFSFVLYATQVAVLGNAKTPLRKGLLLLAGVTSGLLLLTAFFLFVQPETFRISSVWEIVGEYRTNSVDVVIGLISLSAGMYVLLLGQRHRERQSVLVPQPPVQTKGRMGGAALFSFGFVRAITRITGVAALLLGVRTIIHATNNLLVGAALIIILLGAAMLPYLVILAARYWRPNFFVHIERYLAKAKNLRPYRTVGVSLIVMGILFMLLSFLPI